MNANPSPPDFELPCIELVMAVLSNAIEEIQQLCHPVPRLRQRIAYFGKGKNHFADLRWFLTSPDGAELLTTAAGINGILNRYRKQAMPMLAEAERLASTEFSSDNPIVGLISASKKQVIQSQEPEKDNLYSSVDIIASEQVEMFPDFFTSTRASR